MRTTLSFPLSPQHQITKKLATAAKTPGINVGAAFRQVQGQRQLLKKMSVLQARPTYHHEHHGHQVTHRAVDRSKELAISYLQTFRLLSFLGH